MSGDTNWPTPSIKILKRLTDDVISMFIDVLSFEYCAVLRTFQCQGSLLYTVADTVVGYFFVQVSANDI